MRFTAEYRNEEFQGECCVVDEDYSFFGSAIIYNLTWEEAEAIAKSLNAAKDLKMAGDK